MKALLCCHPRRAVPSPSSVHRGSLRAVLLAVAAIFVGASAPVHAQILCKEVPVIQTGQKYALATNGSLLAVFYQVQNSSGGGILENQVRVYTLSGKLVRIIRLPGDNARDGSLVSLATSGNLLAVGAPREMVNGLERGTVFLYQLSTGKLLQTIDNFGGGVDEYGAAVALSGDLLVVGAPSGNSVDQADTGFVQVRNLRTGVNTNIYGTHVGGRFGHAVAVDASAGNGYVAIGEPDFDTGISHLYSAGNGLPILNTILGGGSCVALGGSRFFLCRSAGAGPDGPFIRAITLPSLGLLWDSSLSAASRITSLAAHGDLLAIGDGGADRAGATDAGLVRMVRARDGESVADLAPPSGGEANHFFGRRVAVHGSNVFVLGDVYNLTCYYHYSPVRSPLPFDELALKGSSAPGTLGGAFKSFAQLATSSDGAQSLFLATTTGRPALGVWAATPNAGGAILSGPYFGSGLAIKTVTNMVVNHSSANGVTAMVSGSGINATNDRAFITNSSNNAFAEGKVVAGPLLVQSFIPPRQASNLADSFATIATYRRIAGAVSASQDSGLVAFNTTGLVGGHLQEGSSDLQGSFFGQFAPRIAGAYAVLAFTAALQSGPSDNLAVYGGNIGVLERKGGTAESPTGSPLGTYTNFVAETAGPGTHVFVRATIKPATGPGLVPQPEGIWSNRTTGAANLLQILGKNATYTAEGSADLKIKSFLRFASDNQSNLLVWATLQGAGVTAANDGVILLSRSGSAPGTLELLLREGYHAPGCGARVGAIQVLNSEPLGAYAILASLVSETGGANASNNQALFVGSMNSGDAIQTARRLPGLLLRKGQRFERAGAETVKSISLPGYFTDGSGALNTGLGHVVTRFPLRATAVVTWSDGQVSVMRLSLGL